MYRHILIATDGSEFAFRAARHGLQLASSLRARVSVLMVTPPWQAIALSEIALGRYEEQYAARMETYAKGCLDKVASAAAGLNLSCSTLHVSGDRAYEAIIDAATRQGCDLIVVGSHGRRGVSRALLGSETVKVLAHSKIPVLVYRE